jgi:hypothetical protein
MACAVLLESQRSTTLRASADRTFLGAGAHVGRGERARGVDLALEAGPGAEVALGRRRRVAGRARVPGGANPLHDADRAHHDAEAHEAVAHVAHHRRALRRRRRQADDRRGRGEVAGVVAVVVGRGGGSGGSLGAGAVVGLGEVAHHLDGELVEPRLVAGIRAREPVVELAAHLASGVLIPQGDAHGEARRGAAAHAGDLAVEEALDVEVGAHAGEAVGRVGGAVFDGGELLVERGGVLLDGVVLTARRGAQGRRHRRGEVVVAVGRPESQDVELAPRGGRLLRPSAACDHHRAQRNTQTETHRTTHHRHRSFKPTIEGDSTRGVRARALTTPGIIPIRRALCNHRVRDADAT